MSELPSGTVTFLFTDVEDASRLLRELGSERYEAVLASHNRLLHDVLGQAGGSEIDRHGDSFFVAFPSAGAAVAAAAAAQRALAAHDWPAGVVDLRVRIGLHTGEAMLGSDGYVGFAVHKAARIGAAGHGGQVLLSAVTAELVEHDLPEGVRLRDLGETRLQSVEGPERIFQLVIDGLRDRFPPLATRVGRVPDTALPLLEREAELAAIQRLLGAARGGAGRLVAIQGRPGIGKTRLVAETRVLASGAEFDVLSARGGELEQQFAWGVVRQLFEPLLAAAPPAARKELLSGPAELAAPLVDTSASEALDGSGDASFALLHGLYWLTANAAQRRATLLAIDDLHWCDGPSLRWLVYLARRLEGLPLLVVTGLRPPETSHEAGLLNELLGGAEVVLIRPTALSVDAVARLARESLQAEPDPEFVAACHGATGGNPLYVRALLETLVAEGVRPGREQARVVYEIGPEAVTRAVALRLGRLPAQANALAHAAAILSDGSALEPAAALAGLDREAAAQAALTLLRADVLRSQDPLEFVHPVVRASVYDAIPTAERTERHRRAAELLAAAGAEPEQVAAHLLVGLPAGDPFVVEQLRAAATRARERGATETAISYLRRALEEPPQPDKRGAVLRQLGSAEGLIDAAAAAEHLAEALELVDDPQAGAEIALEYGRALLRDFHHLEAAEAFRRGLERLGDTPSDTRECLEAELIGTGWFELELLPETLARLPSVREDTLLGGLGSDLLLAALAYDEGRHGLDRDRAIELSRRALASGRLRGAGARSLYYIGYTLTIADCFEDAQRLYDEAIGEARQRGDLIVMAATLLFRGALSLYRGDLRRAEADLRESIEIATFQGATPYHVGFLGQLLLERGEVEEAAATIERMSLPKELPPNPHLIFYVLARAKLALAERRFVDALEDLTTLGAHMDAFLLTNPGFASWRAPAVEALVALGREQEARALAEEEVKRARRWGAPRTIGRALRAQGVADGRADEPALREAVSVLGNSEAELERAHALVALGSTLRRTGNRAEARELLQLGLELAHRLGASPLAERAHEELAATGAPLQTMVASSLDTLDPSERRVAEMAAEGLTEREIAQALFLTPKAVEVHLASVYEKLDIGSSAQLVGALGKPPAPTAVAGVAAHD